MGTMAHILVVDDDPQLHRTVRDALVRDGHKITSAMDGDTGLDLALNAKPDLIVLDIAMPGMDGLAVCRRIRSTPALEQIPILFFTSHNDPDEVAIALDAGGDDYVRKPCHPVELRARVRVALRRQESSANAPDVIEVGELTLVPNLFQVVVKEREVSLTPTEYRLMHYLMSHPETAFSSQHLLEVVWKYPPDTGSPDVVRTTIRNLRAKVEEDPVKPVYIRTLTRHGYTLFGSA